MIRGISGGQKKRVTTGGLIHFLIPIGNRQWIVTENVSKNAGEMLVGPSKALFMDEISTGLDSSTTFQVVNSLRQSIHIMKGTVLMALLQPEPETFQLFDDIILISEGHIVYQGPREFVLEFFQSMGFKCPDRKGIADFLQEVGTNKPLFSIFPSCREHTYICMPLHPVQVTSKKDQQQYWADSQKPYRYITVREFAEAFKSFHVGQQLASDLATPYDKTKSHPAALMTRDYGVSKKELLKACFSREILLMRRNSFLYIFKLSQVSL